MTRHLLVLAAISGLAACSIPAVQAENGPSPIAPVYVKLPNGYTSLSGWKPLPAPHSSNRIVIDQPGYSQAMVLSVTGMPLEFQSGLEVALEKEGLRNVVVMAQHELSGSLVAEFQEATQNPAGRYASFAAMAEGSRGPVKIAGLWIQQPRGEGAGSSYEMFIAAPDEYRSLGGWFVPAARYFQNYLPNATDEAILEFGDHDPTQATKNLAGQFGDFMHQILRGKALTEAMTQQTLSIQQGLGQSQRTGLQDPIYDW